MNYEKVQQLLASLTKTIGFLEMMGDSLNENPERVRQSALAIRRMMPELNSEMEKILDDFFHVFGTKHPPSRLNLCSEVSAPKQGDEEPRFRGLGYGVTKHGTSGDTKLSSLKFRNIKAVGTMKELKDLLIHTKRISNGMARAWKGQIGPVGSDILRRELILEIDGETRAFHFHVADMTCVNLSRQPGSELIAVSDVSAIMIGTNVAVFPTDKEGKTTYSTFMRLMDSYAGAGFKVDWSFSNGALVYEAHDVKIELPVSSFIREGLENTPKNKIADMLRDSWHPFISAANISRIIDAHEKVAGKELAKIDSRAVFEDSTKTYDELVDAILNCRVLSGGVMGSLECKAVFNGEQDPYFGIVVGNEDKRSIYRIKKENVAIVSTLADTSEGVLEKLRYRVTYSMGRLILFPVDSDGNVSYNVLAELIHAISPSSGLGTRVTSFFVHKGELFYKVGLNDVPMEVVDRLGSALENADEQKVKKVLTESLGGIFYATGVDRLVAVLEARYNEG
jgi:hypothetical protein